MQRSNLKRNILAAILSALTVALSLLIIIPIPATHGMVTLCEVGIYVSAILFGNPIGLLVGGTSGFLIDLISGYPEWCLFSLVIHGVQGMVVGYLAKKHSMTVWTIIRALVIGSCVMVTGYFFATALLFGWPAGLASLPGNLIQVLFGSAVTVPLTETLIKLKPNLMRG